MPYINTYMRNLRENGIKDLMYRAEIETQKNEWMPRKQGVGWEELEGWD